MGIKSQESGVRTKGLLAFGFGVDFEGKGVKKGDKKGKKREKCRNIAFFCKKICVCQKKAVLLHPLLKIER